MPKNSVPKTARDINLLMKNFLIFLFLVGIIFWRYETSRPKFVDGQKIRITERVLSEPLLFESSQRIVLSGIKVYLPKYPRINYGDTVVVEGLVTDGGLGSPKLVEIKKSDSILFKTRASVVSFYKRVLPIDDAALVAGMVLGSKEAVSSTFWDQLKVTGTAHVVVASGMNVTLVAGFLVAVFLLFLPRGKAVFAAIAGIWLYSLFSGMDAPIVRAAIMGTIAFGAQALGRVYLAWRGLALSAFLMLLVKPLWLVDLGFVLSVVATASLMLFEAKVARFIQFVPRLLREGLSTSLAAQVGVAPILFLTFGQFNLLSPIINSLVLWAVPLITIIGGIAGVLSVFSFGLAKAVLLLVLPLTTWFIWIVNIFG